jgi:hypothetical protein
LSRISQQIFENVETLPEEMQEETLSFVQFLHNKLKNNVENLPKTEPNGTALARLMTEIAERGTAFKEIKDPAAWQREISILHTK